MYAPIYQTVSPQYEYQTLKNKPARFSTGKFYIKNKDGTSGTGTGFSIGNGLFLTAGHNLTAGGHMRNISNFNIDKSFIVFEEDNNFRCGIEKIVSFYYSDKIDFALIKLDKIPNYSLKLNLSLDPSQLLGQEVFIPQYPKGGTMKVAKGIITGMDFGDSSKGFSEVNSLSMSDSSHYFRYTCGTMKGSSGSPVIFEDTVIGIHIKGIESTQDYHTATKILSLEKIIKQAIQEVSNSPLPKSRI